MTGTYLFIDTETTGFKKTGLIVEGQARVCQIAMILTDENNKLLGKFSSYIKPDGWTISEGAQKVHAITDEHCEKYGLDINEVIWIFLQLASKAEIIVAHNSAFDKSMIEVEDEYCFHEVIEEGRDHDWKKKQWHCTMETNRHINNGKNPSLRLALEYFCQRESTGAHDALVDAEACREIFFATRGIRDGK